MNAAERSHGGSTAEAADISELRRRVADALSARGEEDVRTRLRIALAALDEAPKLFPAFRLPDSASDSDELASAVFAHLTGGTVRKVSVSMPEGLTKAVRKRVGPGGFSRYVTEAVARQFKLDLLADLLADLETEHGAVPEDLLAEAEATWPDESEA